MAFLGKVKVCAAHVAPVFLDTPATIEKACGLIAEAARNGTRLIAFPESFVPGFPVWAALAAPIRGHDNFKRLAAASIKVPGEEAQRLCQAAKANEIFVSIGISEATEASVGCLWNSNLIIGPSGTILSHHRKLVPTFYEKLIWANGDGAGLKVQDTEIGRLGMLICGENTNPLARYTLISQGEQLHVSSYPPIWPTRDPREAKRYNLESAIAIRAGAHAFEGKLFNIVASAAVDKTLKAALEPLGRDAMRIIEESPRAVSMIVGPSGEAVGETLSADQGLLYQEIDLADCVEPKQFHDVSGYYNRYDVFALEVNMARTRPAYLRNVASDEASLEADLDGPPVDVDRAAKWVPATLRVAAD